VSFHHSIGASTRTYATCARKLDHSRMVAIGLKAFAVSDIFMRSRSGLDTEY
jgi:hypothetical protein